MGLFSHRVSEEESQVIPDYAKKTHRISEFFISLIAEAAYEISRKGNTRDSVSYMLDQVEICFSGMIPPHSEEHVSVARLSGDVDLLADIGLRSNHVQQSIRKVLGMRRSESEPDLRCCI